MRSLHALLLALAAAARGADGAGQALAPLAQSLLDADRTQNRRLVGGFSFRHEGYESDVKAKRAAHAAMLLQHHGPKPDGKGGIVPAHRALLV